LSGPRERRGPHPGIRVLALLLLAAALPQRPLLDLLLLALLLALAYARWAPQAARSLVQGLWRLRWLLLAILVLYWGFTPGEPLLTVTPGLSREGVLEGSRRALVLVCLLAAVYLLMATTPLTRLLTGLRWLLRPLGVLGIPTERFTLRLALALDAATQARPALDAAQRTDARMLDAAAALVARIEADARTPAPPWTLPAEPAPRLRDWLLPLLILPFSLGWAI
jgi:hypothetical protein